MLHFSSPSQPLLPWITVFLLSAIAWLVLLQQALSMYSLGMPLFGTMGLAIGPFVLFWSLMMIAMMFPAIAPTIAGRYQLELRQKGKGWAFGQMLVFLGGYLLVWTLFGGPAFLLAWLGENIVIHAPLWGIGLGIVLLLAIGCYQMTPWEKYYLTHCHGLPCCNVETPTGYKLLSQLEDGLVYGLHCLGCCGALMLVMEVVGLMNVPWMLLITIIVFLEKTWSQGVRLSFFVGFGLLIFAMLALAVPELLPGLYRSM